MIEKKSNKQLCRERYLKVKDSPEYQRRVEAYAKRRHEECLWKRALGSAKSRAKALSLDFDLDDRWAKERFTGYCELTGIQFSSKDKFYAPSIDRIVPSRGYVRDNCRYILFSVNHFKNNKQGDSDILYVAQKLVKPIPHHFSFPRIKEHPPIVRKYEVEKEKLKRQLKPINPSFKISQLINDI